VEGKASHKIDKWKYEAVRRAILNNLKVREEGVLLSELAGMVEQNLSPYERQNLGNVSWYTMTVKLDLEVKGEIRRVDKSTPQRLILDYVPSDPNWD
jgi:hypothetical protein